jgi:site-specific DNA-cytosine methylase
MWEVIRYAGRVVPKIVIFESVQQAYSQGRGLMSALHAELESISGRTYKLHHVLHNNAGLGGMSIRRRYFWVAVRDDVVFGVEDAPTRYDFRTHQTVPYELTRVPTLGEAFQDLEPLALTMQPQGYRGTYRREHLDWNEDRHEYEVAWEDPWITVGSASWWAQEHMHDGTGTVDGHDVFRSPTLSRIKEMMRLESWAEGEKMSDVMRRYYERTGELPESWRYMSRKPMLTTDGQPILDDKGKKMMEPIRKDKRLIETDFAMGHNQPSRWHGSRMARVITGGAVHLFVHPTQPRSFTHREAARIQGFPDAWKIWPVRNAADLGPGWGKGVPVHAGRWIAYWAKQSIEGNPGSIQGDAVGDDREYDINITNTYKKFAKAIGDPG